MIPAWGIAPQRKGAKAVKYSEYLSVEENDEILLKGSPSVILQVNSASDIDAIDFSKNEKPSNVILTLNKSLDVVDSRGDKISSFSDAFVNKIYKKAISVVRIEDEETADAFVTLLKNQSEIEDTATVFAIRKNDGYAEIIASYDDGECLSYTCAFRADYQKQSSGGCGASFSAECALVPIVVLIIAVVTRKRVSRFRKEK